VVAAPHVGIIWWGSTQGHQNTGEWRGHLCASNIDFKLTDGSVSCIFSNQQGVTMAVEDDGMQSSNRISIIVKKRNLIKIEQSFVKSEFV